MKKAMSLCELPLGLLLGLGWGRGDVCGEEQLARLGNWLWSQGA